jgi:hypothetical protein
VSRRLTKGRDLVQTRNPRTDCYVMIDRDEGRIIGHKPSPGPYKNVPIAHRRRRG